MKKFITLFLLVVGYLAFSQNNDIVVYTLESEPFYVILNGIRQNENLETNIRVENVDGEFHRMRVIFENDKFPPLDQSINFFESNSEIKIEIVYRKNKFRTRFMGESKKDNKASKEQTHVSYHQEGESNASVNSTSGSESQTKESGQIKNSSSENSVKVEVNERGIKTEISVQDNSKEEVSAIQFEEEVKEDLNIENVYHFLPNGSMCNRPSVSQKDYMEFRYGIEEENMFSRQEYILNFFKENCMIAAQVAGIVQLDYSTVKSYEIAKNGYRYTWDTENYEIVLASLKNENDRQKLINFLDVGVDGESIEEPTIEQGKTEIKAEQAEVVNNILVTGYSGGVNCDFGVFVDAEALKEAADQESFSADKMKVIRKNSQGKCFSVEDVKIIAETFIHESDKIDFLELAFHNTYDAGSFYKVVDVLTHSASKEKLGIYVQEQSGARFGVAVDENNQMPVAGYKGKVGSILPIINQEDFISTLTNQVFQKDKMMVIDLALASYSMTTSQFIKAAEAAFTSEKDILEFASMANSNIYDKDNFHQVKEIFSFNSSKNEFDEIINQ